MLNRLAGRLVLSHLLVIAVAMGLLGFLMLSMVQGYFEQAVRESLLVQARIAARAITASQPLTVSNISQAMLPAASNAVQQQALNRAPRDGEDGGTAPYGLDPATLQLSSQLDTRIRLIDAKGMVAVDSLGAETGRDLAGDPLVVAALAGSEQARVEAGEMRVAVPLAGEGGVPGAVYLSQPLRDVAAVLADLRGRLALSAVIALALSGLVGLLLARAIARPVAELTAAADRLAQGDFDYPLPAASPDELGRLAASFGSMRDELHRTLQARADLVTNVSHELRTPLTAIKGLTETLRDGAVDDLDARDRFLASVERQADRLIRLVNDLLLLSRADNQALGLRRERLDLSELARTTAGELAPQAEAADVAIVVHGASVFAAGDPDRLRQVLVNLLDNALNYSPAGAAVTVHTAALPEGAIVSVQDCGPGIPPEDLPRVFERFYRGDRSRQRERGSASGSGLGLAIAKALIEAHGGSITLESRRGEGTKVTFSLPAG